MYYMLELTHKLLLLWNDLCFSKTMFKFIGYLHLVIPDNCLLPQHIISRKIYNSVAHWLSVFLELESFPGPLEDQETVGDNHWRTGKGDLGFSPKYVTYYLCNMGKPFSPPPPIFCFLSVSGSRFTLLNN